MKRCAKKECNRISISEMYCSTACKKEARVEIEHIAATKKYGKGWDKDRECKLEGCNELIKFEKGMKPSAFMRKQYHSVACSRRDPVNQKKKGCTVDNAKRAIQRLKRKSKAEKAKEKVERIAFSRTPERFAMLTGHSALVFNALRAERFGDVPDCH